MSKEELAELLNGREYRNEMTQSEEQLAADSDLIVITGYSDDNAELRGAISDEVSCHDGGKLVLYNYKGEWSATDADEDNVQEIESAREQVAVLDAIEAGKVVEALWCTERDYSWTYKTDLPHASFDILEDGGKYCRGIVISLSDLK